MLLAHVWGLFTHPAREWSAIRAEPCTVGRCFVRQVLVLAAIPAVSGFIGATYIGWQIGAREPARLTPESAAWIAILYYLTMLVAVFAIGAAIHWMGRTYGARQSLGHCVTLAAYTATPLFLIGIMQLYPVLWLNFVVGLPALAYTVYLLYAGLPIMMSVSPERGFLFSSAVLAVGLVMLVGLLAVTVLLWSLGFEPVLTG